MNRRAGFHAIFMLFTISIFCALISCFIWLVTEPTEPAPLFDFSCFSDGFSFPTKVKVLKNCQWRQIYSPADSARYGVWTPLSVNHRGESRSGLHAGTERSHPLRRMVGQQVKGFRSHFLLLYKKSGFAHLSGARFVLRFEPIISSLDCGSSPKGNPFSHPSGSSALPGLFLKGPRAPCLSASEVRTGPFSGSRKRSVPVRVHSVYSEL
jgi:hypothetical protein